MKKILNEGNQIHNVISSSGFGTVINYGSGSDFLTSYGSDSGSGSTSQKVTVPTVPVPVPQRYLQDGVRVQRGLPGGRVPQVAGGCYVGRYVGAHSKGQLCFFLLLLYHSI
jgi:hypothetical protein